MYSEGREIEVSPDELIVSMTDARGNITYANDIFCDIAGYTREEVIGKPHNMIRHPEMPKAVFKLLWDRVKKGKVIYAFVKNKAKNGDFYWVKAYVNPVMKNGRIDKMISYRKPISAYAKNTVTALYAQLVAYEKNHSAEESLAFLTDFLKERNLTYDVFVERLSQDKQVTNIEALKIDMPKYHNAHTLVQANIKNRVANGEKNIKVVDACCCEFGKWCEGVKHESFTSHASWREVLKHHEMMHQGLRNFVQKSDEGESAPILNQILGDIAVQTKHIFASLEDVIDHCA